MIGCSKVRSDPPSGRELMELEDAKRAIGFSRGGRETN